MAHAAPVSPSSLAPSPVAPSPVVPAPLPLAPLAMMVPVLASVPPLGERRGVVVVGVGDAAADASWPVAQALYGAEDLRPALSDREARALAGEPLAANASADLKDLASLRAQARAEDDAASRTILAEIARRTRARALAVVSRSAELVEVRIYDAVEDRLEASRHVAEKGTGWKPLITSLQTRFAQPKVVTPEPKPVKAETEKSGSSFWSSPWFWGALGAAAAAGVVVWAVSRDDPAPAPVRIEWGGR